MGRHSLFVLRRLLDFLLHFYTDGAFAAAFTFFFVFGTAFLLGLFLRLVFFLFAHNEFS